MNKLADVLVTRILQKLLEVFSAPLVPSIIFTLVLVAPVLRYSDISSSVPPILMK